MTKVGWPKVALLGCLVAVWALAGGSLARAASWVLPAKTIYTGAGAPSTVRDVAAAEAPDGNAYAAWLDGGNAYVSEHPAGGSFPATAQVLGTADGDPPQMAVDASGDVIVVWAGSGGVVQGVQQAPGGTFQPLTLPTTSGAQSVQIAAGGDGTVIVAWQQGNPSQIMYSLRRPGGSFGAAATVPGSTNLYTYSIAADKAGDIAVGFITLVFGTAPNMTYSVYGGYWGHNGSGFSVSGTALDTQATTSSDPTLRVANVKVAMSPGGDAIVTWTTNCMSSTDQCGGLPPGNYSNALVASIRNAQASSFSAKDVITTSTADPDVIWTPAAAFDGSGNVVVAWGLSTGSDEVDQSQASVAGGTFSSPAAVASATGGTPETAIGSLSSGQIVVAYTTGNNPGQMWGAIRPNGPLGTAFGAGTQVSAISGSIIDQPGPALATQGDDAVVDWALYTTPAVQAVGYSGNPPTVTVNAPPTGTTGQPVSVSASAAGIWTTASVSSIDFGDGSPPSSGASASHTYAAPGTYTITANASDGADNTGSGTARIVVSAPPAGSGTTGTKPTTGPTGPTGPPAGTAGPKPKPKCVVPKLKHETLAAAKRALTRAHCRLGKVKRPKPRRHSRPLKLVVVAQSRDAGKRFPQGTKVNVRLGPAPPKKHKRHGAVVAVPPFPL